MKDAESLRLQTMGDRTATDPGCQELLTVRAGVLQAPQPHDLWLSSSSYLLQRANCTDQRDVARSTTNFVLGRANIADGGQIARSDMI
jgi:hypothetical protein